MGQGKPIMVELDGREMRFSTACRLLGVAVDAGRNRWQALGCPYVIPKILGAKTPEWSAWRRQQKEGDQKRLHVAIVEDQSPGWAERKYFSDAGKNGFCKCERQTGIGNFSGKDLFPILTGD